MRMAHVVGDEDHADALLAHLVDGRQDVGGLTHAERRSGLVEDQHLGTEVDGAGDGDGLPLAAREGADRLLRTRGG